MVTFSSTHAVNCALLEHVEALVARELPVREGPYALVPCKVPEEEHEARGGQEGPVVHGEGLVFVYLHFDGLDRQGRPWGIEQAVRVCAADERGLARVTAIVQAFARVARRAMRDAGDDRFGERPWLGLVNLAGAMYSLERAPKKRTRTAEECEAVLCASRDLRDVLAPPAEALDAAIQALDGWLAAHPTLAKKPQMKLVHVPKPTWSSTARPSPQGVEVRRDGLLVTIQLIIYDNGAVRDIKEQQLWMVPATALADMPRVLAFLDGWVAALDRALEQPGPPPTGAAARKLPRLRRGIDMCMPHDLFDVTVLTLKTPRTAADFEAAFARRWKLD